MMIDFAVASTATLDDSGQLLLTGSIGCTRTIGAIRSIGFTGEGVFGGSTTETTCPADGESWSAAILPAEGTLVVGSTVTVSWEVRTMASRPVDEAGHSGSVDLSITG
jgi:hypothetical protein